MTDPKTMNTPHAGTSTHTGAAMPTNDPLKTSAQNTANTAKREAEKARETAANKATAYADEARGMADRAKARASEEVESRYAAAASAASEQTDRAAAAAHDVADRFEDGSPMERAATRAGDQIEQWSEAIRSSDLSQIQGEVVRFARRNPIAFIGGAALLGFAAARLAKASERHDTVEPMATPDPYAPRAHPGAPASPPYNRGV